MSVSASGDYGVVAATTGRETITLHGTLGTPIVASHTAPFGFDSHAVWLFGVAPFPSQSIERGQTQRATYTFVANFTSVNTEDAWVIPNDFAGSYWIRAQHDTGGVNEFPNFNNSTITKVIGSADNPADWVTLTNGGTDRHWGWEETQVFNTREGIIKVEISTTQSEAGIVATGFYRGVAFVQTP